jgi:hypothetical protein
MTSVRKPGAAISAFTGIGTGGATINFVADGLNPIQKKKWQASANYRSG